MTAVRATGLYCLTCGQRARDDQPRVERREVRDARGRVVRTVLVAIVARCGCGAEQRVNVKQGRRLEA